MYNIYLVSIFSSKTPNRESNNLISCYLINAKIVQIFTLFNPPEISTEIFFNSSIRVCMISCFFFFKPLPSTLKFSTLLYDVIGIKCHAIGFTFSFSFDRLNSLVIIKGDCGTKNNKLLGMNLVLLRYIVP